MNDSQFHSDETTVAGALGRVTEIWRYPVRSFKGERLDGAEVTATGVAGDRAYGVFDAESGEEGQASRRLRWGGLIEMAANSTVHGRVRIALADGTDFAADDRDADARLSAVLGRPVHLRRVAGDADVPRAYDFKPVHLITTSTLAALAAAHPDGAFAVPRFRPNLVIDTGTEPGFVENAWIGRDIAIGRYLRLRVTEPCVRCALTTSAQHGDGFDVPEDKLILHTVRRRNEGNAGVLATVVDEGPVAVYDLVHEAGR